MELLNLLLISLVINIAMFLVAYKLRSDKLTDASYAVTFITLTLVAFSGSLQSIGHVLLAVIVCIWAVRIGGFLLYRVSKVGKDRRFDGVREDFVQFGKFWLVQAVTVWALLLSVAMAFQQDIALTGVAVVGLLVWFAGFAIETIADIQKYRFHEELTNKGKWIESGIWKYSRHPNYFGEILVWIGVYVFVVQSLNLTQSLVALVSPIFIAVLLIFFSGIPPLEKSADKRWGNLKAYKDYKKSTSILIPLPKQK